MSNWYSGCGEEIDDASLSKEISQHIKAKGKIFIGSDSMIRGHGCVFASAICLHGADSQKGGKYFFNRKEEKSKSYKSLQARIMKEVEKSINIGLKLLEEYPNAEIEIHMDVGTTKKSQTRGLVETLRGWATSVGFKSKVKPYAWASASVADKHTK